MWLRKVWASQRITRKKCYTIVDMSQQLREFIKQSGVEVRPTNSPSSVSTTASNNALIREIEADMAFPPRLEKNIISNEN